jgi:Ca2+:H+ antiporter
MRILRWLLLLLPVAVLAKFLGNELLIFGASALAIIPLAGYLGEATEVLAEKTGPRVGGLLNATLGNAAELIIALIAIRAGKLELVKASLIGSILGNVLLVLGLSILLGGLKNGVQKFNRTHAGIDATMMILAVIALSIPSIFNAAIEPDKLRVEELSLTTDGVTYLNLARQRKGKLPPASRRRIMNRVGAAGWRWRCSFYRSSALP